MSRPPLPAYVLHSRVVVVARQLRRDRLESLLSFAAPNEMVFEVTYDTPTADTDIGWLRGLGYTVGAGTVLTVEDASHAVGSGAEFLVAPLFDEDVVEWAVHEGIPIAPGAMTPTEIARAWNAGAAAVKIFPASAVGPALPREVRGPLGHIPLMPTGGIGAHNAASFIDAGAIAVGVGGWLTASPDAELENRWRELTAAVRTNP